MESINFGPNIVGLLLLLGTGLYGVARDSHWGFRLLCAGFACLAAATLGHNMY